MSHKIKVFVTGRETPIVQETRVEESGKKVSRSIDEALANNCFVSFGTTDDHEILVRSSNVTHVEIEKEDD
ncbi:hypothetical protein ABC345_02095 [Shouchella sp. 1P09AA]|uniref:hypothetical protein n=1 Tax=unclassified Shouchella TaxID=2893065 RepID=UPI0039A19BC2